MTRHWPRWLAPEWIMLAAALVFPLFPGDPAGVGAQLTNLFVFAILALALNVVLGYTGLLHLGIAAFFGIGAYTTGILTAPGQPFQIGFVAALAIATVVSALGGLLLGAPTLRLRGDYLALVTLGFGEVVRYAIQNLDHITNGTKGLFGMPAPATPVWLHADWSQEYRWFYFLILAILVAVMWMLRNLERSALGRAWMAIREDELAAQCMGINTARVKLAAFSIGAGLAGAAGCLYATMLATTGQPNSYGFATSVTVLCCVILGGLGSRAGTLLGVFLLLGFDNILSPMIDRQLQNSVSMKDYRLMVFGLALILVMRFRPAGLLPAGQMEHELQIEHLPTTTGGEA